MNVKAVARLAILTCITLVLGYLESLIPLGVAPGVKLGLANTVLLYAVYLMGPGSAALLMLMKVLLSGLLFGGISAMLYSMAGGVLSLSIMLLLRRSRHVGVIGVSVAGAVCHNIGQLLMACLMVESRALLGYLPILLISAAVTGLLTGVIAKYAIKGVQAYAGKKESPHSGD